jgi:nucleoside-diphosphate-sugar epimerase
VSRVLVTGASGFIGARTLAPLRERGFEVHAVARAGRPQASAPDGVTWHAADLLDDDAGGALIRRVRPTHLLHLAWYAEPGAFWSAPENADWVAATVRLVGAFGAAGGLRVVLAGTCAEYDWNAGGVLTESSPPAPATFYGIAKDATRRVAEGLGSLHGATVAAGRVFFLYGPGEDPRRLVASVARGLLNGERVATSEGRQVRDFMHVQDVAGAFAALVAADTEGPVNIGSGDGVEVRRVVDLVAQAAGRPDLLDVGALEMRADEPAVLVADARRLHDEVGFRPETGLEDGIAETVDWWRSR